MCADPVARLLSFAMLCGFIGLFAIEESHMPLRITLALIVIVLFVLFGAQNIDPVGLRLFFWQFTVPASVAVVGAFACGVIVGALLFWTEQRRAKRRQGVLTGQLPAKKKASWWW